MKRLLSSVNGITETFEKDKAENKIVICQTRDVEPEIEANKAELNNNSENWKGDLHKVASIPLIVVEQWWKELKGDPFSKENRAWLKRKLNSNEFMYFRTKAGRI